MLTFVLSLPYNWFESYVVYVDNFDFQSIEMKIDNCGISACMGLTAPQGSNEFLNVNSPMQVGGTLSNLAYLAHNLGWNHTPTEKGFVGCIRNMTFNGNVSIHCV